MHEPAGPYKMVTSVGWNPFFDNKTMTVEPHLLHAFPADFYGSEIRIVITGEARLAAPRAGHAHVRMDVCNPEYRMYTWPARDRATPFAGADMRATLFLAPFFVDFLQGTCAPRPTLARSRRS